MKRSQVTSKRGDKGETTTLGGDHVLKAHLVIECVGCVDEVRASLALLRQRVQAERPADKDSEQFLLWLLHCCFALGSQCSDPRNEHPEYRKVDIDDAQIARLEAFQESLEAQVRLPHSFIVSASNELAAQTDVITTLVRRLERAVVRLHESEPQFDCSHIFVFINRLSDTLYMLARYFDGGDFHTVDYSVLEA